MRATGIEIHVNCLETYQNKMGWLFQVLSDFFPYPPVSPVSPVSYTPMRGPKDGIQLRFHCPDEIPLADEKARKDMEFPDLILYFSAVVHGKIVCYNFHQESRAEI